MGKPDEQQQYITPTCWSLFKHLNHFLWTIRAEITQFWTLPAGLSNFCSKSINKHRIGLKKWIIYTNRETVGTPKCLNLKISSKCSNKKLFFFLELARWERFWTRDSLVFHTAPLLMSNWTGAWWLKGDVSSGSGDPETDLQQKARSDLCRK